MKKAPQMGAFFFYASFGQEWGRGVLNFFWICRLMSNILFNIILIIGNTDENLRSRPCAGINIISDMGRQDHIGNEIMLNQILNFILRYLL